MIFFLHFYRPFPSIPAILLVARRSRVERGREGRARKPFSPGLGPARDPRFKVKLPWGNGFPPKPHSFRFVKGCPSPFPKWNPPTSTRRSAHGACCKERPDL